MILSDDIMQDLFDLACSGEIKLTVFSDFEECLPVFRADLMFTPTLTGKPIEVYGDCRDSPQEAIGDVVRLMKI